jgi:predicted transcriptional regulator
MTAKTITLRLHPEIYQRAANLAQRRDQSLNRLFQDGLELLAAQEQEKQLFDDFSLIAEAGSEETDVHFALVAQAQATAEK